MSRPVGARVIAICEVLALRGAMSYPDVCEVMPELERANVYKYCQRAVGLRLLSVNRSVSPAQYSLLPGWRDRLGAKKHVPRAVAPVRTAWVGPRTASVWDLGMMA